MPADQVDQVGQVDPFGTVALRARVLDAWTASPARFREDANAEDDLVRGSYRDRVVVELAQNAADAALRAGGDGRLLLRLAGDRLEASNSGAPLDAAGAESLATLRASAKRAHPESVGRFGVGFAAVLAVSDEPAFASTSGALAWSVARTREAVTAVPALAEEAARRHGQLPVLRLPFADVASPEPGYASTVRLPLRDADAVALVRRLLDEVDDALLLALPGLGRVTVDVDGVVREVVDEGRWDVVRRGGALDPSLLRDRPVEERDRATWSLTWGRPLAGQPVPPMLHAPTPTDEPLALPALLVASFPLDPGRRHVAPGPLTDFLVAQAAAAYADLAAGAPAPLDLVPDHVPAGPLDATLRSAIVAALRSAPLLTTVDGDRVRPDDATAVAGAEERLRAVLALVLPGLVADHPALDRLGVRRLAPVDVLEALATLDRPPSWWRTLYEAVDGSPGWRDALSGLPVPLTDGRLVGSPRGVIVAAEHGLPDGLELLGLRVAHPGAAHPVLLRGGATEASPDAVLDRPEVAAAVTRLWDDDVPAETAVRVADAVLGLVARAGGGRAWLADLPLVDADGELAAASELALTGSLMARAAAPGDLGRPDPALVDRWGADVLGAVGVLATPVVVRLVDMLLDDPEGTGLDLDDEAGWLDDLRAGLPDGGAGAVLPEAVAVRDLDVVRDEAWPEVLEAVAADPELRSAVVEPVRVVGGGAQTTLPSYAAWWLARHARLAGRAPRAYGFPDAAGLAGLVEPLPAEVAGLDRELLAAIGVRAGLADLLADPGGPDQLLGRLADPAHPVDDDVLAAVYEALATVDPDRVTPPDAVRLPGGPVVPAGEVVVVDAAQHLQLSWSPAPVVVPLHLAHRLATVLDVATTGERLGWVAVPDGVRRPTPEAAQRVLGSVAPPVWVEHEELVVAGAPVDWWVDDEGTPHAATLDGLARALAVAAGRFDLRLLLAAVLAEPPRAAELVTEARLESPGGD